MTHTYKFYINAYGVVTITADTIADARTMLPTKVETGEGVQYFASEGADLIARDADLFEIDGEHQP